MKGLKRTKLIPDNARFKDIQFSKAGRTDKGVSGLGQVIPLNSSFFMGFRLSLLFSVQKRKFTRKKLHPRKNSTIQ